MNALFKMFQQSYSTNYYEVPHPVSESSSLVILFLLHVMVI